MFTITQGTTPTHTFTLPFDTSTIASVRFVYSQEGEVKVVKDGAAVQKDGAKVSTTLTQADTFALTPGVEVRLMLRVLTKGGDALASDVKTGRCRSNADKEVLA